MSILDKRYIVTMPDGTRWSVPVIIIAEDRAAYYAKIDSISSDDAMEETRYVFHINKDSIADWAQNNMNWDDVKKHAVQINEVPDPTDYQEGWINGEYEVAD